MDLYVDDDGFVRAADALVYERLTDIDSWNAWWPGVRAVPLDGDDAPQDGTSDDGETWDMRWRHGATELRFEATAHGWRHEAGFKLRLAGDVTGEAEFWLEPGYGGTVVHHILVGATNRRRPVRVLRAYRRVLRKGLWAFKDRVQSEVRRELGLRP